MSRRYPEATTWLCDQVESVIVDGQLDFPESTYEEMRIGFQIGVELHKVGEKIVYSISDDAAQRIVFWASQTAGYFDAVSNICATNLMQGAPLPLALRMFAATVLRGETTRPKAAHRPRKKNWMECAYLFSLGHLAKKKFELTLTRNDEAGHAHSACDAMAEALTVCGRTTKYSEIKRLFVHPDFARFREENAVLGEEYERKANIKRIVNALASREPQVNALSHYLETGLENL